MVGKVYVCVGLLVVAMLVLPAATADDEPQCDEGLASVDAGGDAFYVGQGCEYNSDDYTQYEYCTGTVTWTQNDWPYLEGPQVCQAWDDQTGGSTCIYPLGHVGGVEPVCIDDDADEEIVEYVVDLVLGTLESVVGSVARDCDDPGALTCYDLGQGGFGEYPGECRGAGVADGAGYAPALLLCEEEAYEYGPYSDRYEQCQSVLLLEGPEADAAAAEACTSSSWIHYPAYDETYYSSCTSVYAAARTVGTHVCEMRWEDDDDGAEDCTAAGVGVGEVNPYDLGGAYECHFYEDPDDEEPASTCYGPAYGDWLYCTGQDGGGGGGGICVTVLGNQVGDCD